MTSWQLPALVVGTAGAAGWALGRGRSSWHGAMVGSALVFLTFVLLAKQAFVNYYWLLGGILCAAVAMLAPSGTEADGEAAVVGRAAG